jgi:hypothetical protein
MNGISSESALFNELARDKRPGLDSEELVPMNMIGFKKSTKTRMLKEMIEKAGKGQGEMIKLNETKLQKRTFKDQYEKPVEKFKVTKKRQIDKRREQNMKNLNKIKIKTKKI